MAYAGSLSRHYNLAELATPRDFPTSQTVAVRQAQARMNLGLAAGGNTATALNATGTLTSAMMIGGIVTSTTAAAVVATLDTATNFETALKAYFGTAVLAVGAAIEFTVVNTGANTFTIATAAGWTDGGGGFQAVAAGLAARFRAVRTAANAYTLYKVG